MPGAAVPGRGDKVDIDFGQHSEIHRGFTGDLGAEKGCKMPSFTISAPGNRPVKWGQGTTPGGLDEGSQQLSYVRWGSLTNN